MKSHTMALVFLFASITGFSQGVVKANSFDKFLKKHRVEMAPLALSGLSANNKLSISLLAIGATYYLQLEGAGWGATTVDNGNELILLLANDSTISLKATSLQSFEPGMSQNTYKHQYFISLKDVKALSRNELNGIRKYSFDVFSDLDVPKANAERIRQLSAVFLDELKKTSTAREVKQIRLKEILQHVGDSVQFCSKVYKTRYFEESADGPTLLDVQADFSDPFVNVVIYKADRAKFNNAPEKRYLNKDVCISGVVEVRNNIPYIVIREKEQIQLKSPISLDEVSLFEGDSITVSGKVFTARYLEDSKTKPTLLNVGAPFPDQPLTLVIEQVDRANFIKPEEVYLNRTVRVSGRVVSFKNKPQIILRQIGQVEVIAGEEPAPSFVSMQSNPAKGGSESTEAAGSNEKPESPGGSLTQPEFPGGAAAFTKFLNENLVYPAALKNNEVRKVVVSFEIDTEGKCNRIKIEESAGYPFDEAVKRALLRMPKWKPAFQNGRPAVGVMTQPVTFRGEVVENRP